ncbi:TetR/AcrR family transcriptional regulator [Vibrio hangzhouensis]|uniref:Transcriptional regulator, TetR family n=1 Tax=Vibrio hangzhouensis TaxID=462991 RepID=A0A1H5RSG4_9VIBR|nr:TetR/AcrR family transcriptional regulator [Vibrio hangzhouensis]SEF41263.1 transcriptional regulator, TetR family [Vibrio hangzhouensis]
MPKFVDHEVMRRKIASDATKIFLEHGYKNLSMRQLCDKLGMSKSNVYYYYKSKDDLFKASTDIAVNFDNSSLLSSRPTSNEANLDEKLENFVTIFNLLSPSFFQEIKLVYDYIDVIGTQSVSEDPAMLVANEKYLSMLSEYVSEKHCLTLFTIMLGLLSTQILRGIQLDRDFIIEQVKKLVDL